MEVQIVNGDNYTDEVSVPIGHLTAITRKKFKDVLSLRLSHAQNLSGLFNITAVKSSLVVLMDVNVMIVALGSFEHTLLKKKRTLNVSTRIYS